MRISDKFTYQFTGEKFTYQFTFYLVFYTEVSIYEPDILQSCNIILNFNST